MSVAGFVFGQATDGLAAGQLLAQEASEAFGVAIEETSELAHGGRPVVYGTVDGWLRGEAESDEVFAEGRSRGRLSEGPAVRISGAAIVGPATIECTPVSQWRGSTRVLSLCNFASAVGTACVVSGRWMYEATLMTDGVQQIGWATHTCRFSLEDGVGDSQDSYAYDGARVKKWNTRPVDYGESWTTGDIIGVCIDLEARQIEFYRNGRSMGVAFQDIRAGEQGVGYLPALSLSYAQGSWINFGATPFAYPVPGFAPLYDPPKEAVLGHAQSLIVRLERVLACAMVAERRTARTPPTRPSGVDECLVRDPDADLGTLGGGAIDVDAMLAAPTTTTTTTTTTGSGSASTAVPPEREDTPLPENASKAATLVAACRVFQFLHPFLVQPYTVEAVWVPFLARLSGQQLSVLLSLAHGALAQHEFDAMLTATLSCVSWQVSSGCGCDPPFLRARVALRVALACVAHEATRARFAALPCFPWVMERLLTLPRPSTDTLERWIPDVWWDGAEALRDANDALARFGIYHSFMHSRNAHEAQRTAVCEMVEVCERRQRALCMLLLADPLHAATFRAWVRDTIERNLLLLSVRPPPGLSHRSVLISLFLVYLSEVEVFTKLGIVEQFPLTLFTHGNAFYDLPRLGGLLSHVRKEFPLASASASVSAAPDTVAGEGAAGEGAAGEGEVGEDVTAAAGASAVGVGEEGSVVPQEIDMIKDCVLLYHLAVEASFKEAFTSSVRRKEAERLLAGMLGWEATRDVSGKEGDKFRSALREVGEYTREAVWHGARLTTMDKKIGLFSLHAYLTRLFEWVGGPSPDPADSPVSYAFPYIPECFLRVMLDSFHGMRRAEPVPLPMTSFPRQTARLIAWLVQHFADRRLVNPDLGEMVVQTVSLLLKHAEYVRAFEDNEVAQSQLIEQVMRTYDDRFWVTVTNTNILLRLWTGRGFACKDDTEQVASPFFQRRFREECEQQPQLFSEFLNCVFNSINWTETEFAAALTELQGAIRPAMLGDMRPLVQAHRRCNVMFELKANLLRLLECVCLELPGVFLDDDEEGEVHAHRLTEVLAYVLSTYTRGGPNVSLFHRIVDEHPFVAERMNVPDIFIPAIGILITLGAHPAKARTLPALLHSQAHVVEHLQALVEWCNTQPSTLFTDDQRAQAHASLNALIAGIEEHALQVPSASISRSPSADICTICYASLIDTTFQPCGHRSCHRCITRQMMNLKRCFFCNADVDALVRDRDRRPTAIPSSPHSPAPHSPAPHSPAPHSPAPHSPAPHSPATPLRLDGSEQDPALVIEGAIQAMLSTMAGQQDDADAPQT